MIDRIVAGLVVLSMTLLVLPFLALRLIYERLT